MPAARKIAVRVPKRGIEEVEGVEEMPAKTLFGKEAEVYNLTADEMAELKDVVYKKCTNKRKMLRWVKCPKCILDPLIERMMRMTGLRKGQLFVDIGSGVGNVVQSMATRAGCDAIGIEIAKPNHEVAVEAHEHFKAFRKENGIPEPNVQFINNDLRKVVPDLYKKADVVWCANKLFTLELDVFMYNAVKLFKPGTRIIVMKNVITHTYPDSPLQRDDCRYFTFTDFAWGAGDVEWTDVPGDLHMYTRTDFVGDDDE